MKQFNAIFMIITALALVSCASILQFKAPIKVMSFNIRCGYCEQSNDINHWSRRKILVADLIKSSRADIIGLQEAEKFQVTDIVSALPEYEWYGIGRDEGGSGEMNAVLIRKSRFKIDSTKTLFLSPTPEQVSIGWDARFRRTLTITKLTDLSSGKTFNFFNAHFDHIGKIARQNSARVIVEEVRRLANEPIVLTGDFNDRPGFDGYTILGTALFDAAIVSNRKPTGGDISFNGFGNDLKPGNKIDYIFVSKHFEVQNHSIITKLYNGHYPSDHYPILSSINLH